MGVKHCPGCKNNLDTECFAKNSKKKDGLQIYCRACKKRIDAKHYRENREEQLARNRRLREKYREEIDAYKAAKGCCVPSCPENDPCCLDFHHPNSDKIAAVAVLTKYSSRKLIFEEIAKCIVICANCHRKFHRGRITLPCNEFVKDK